MTERDITLPYMDGDFVGQRVTLTVEAWVSRVEAEPVNVTTYPDE